MVFKPHVPDMLFTPNCPMEAFIVGLACISNRSTQRHRGRSSAALKIDIDCGIFQDQQLTWALL
jgi:hypothetical protein